MTLLVEGSDLA